MSDDDRVSSEPAQPKPPAIVEWHSIYTQIRTSKRILTTKR